MHLSFDLAIPSIARLDLTHVPYGLEFFERLETWTSLVFRGVLGKRYFGARFGFCSGNFYISGDHLDVFG